MIDIGLGLRVYGDPNWKLDKLLNQASLNHTAGGLLEATCKVNSQEVHTWQFDPSHGYAMIHYSITYPGTGSEYEFVCSDFKEVDGVYVPFTLVRNVKWTTQRWQQPEVVQRQTLKVNKVVLNDLDNVSDSKFEIVWPKDVYVLDLRVDKGFVIRDHDQRLSNDDVNDIFIQQQKARQALIEETRKKW